MPPGKTWNEKSFVSPPTDGAVRSVACAWHEDVQRPGVSHGICSRCFEREMALLDFFPLRIDTSSD